MMKALYLAIALVFVAKNSVALPPSKESPNSIRISNHLVEMIRSRDRAAFSSVINAMLATGTKLKHLENLIGPAAVSQDKFYLDFLLALGCDINWTNKHGENAAVFVVENSEGEETELALKNLVTLGLDIGKRDDLGFQAVHKAVLQGRGDLLLFLTKEVGVDLNAKTEAGKTCLILAAQYGQIEVLKSALALGANVTIVDKSGKTALDWARQPVDGNDFNQVGIDQKARVAAAKLLEATDQK